MSAYTSANRLGANPSMLHPVSPLTVQRAVLDQSTLAANQSRVFLRLGLHAITVLDAAFAAALAESTLAILVKMNVAVDPVAHVL